MEVEKLVCPGDKIGTVDTFLPGEGTYIEGSDIYASLVGLCAQENAKNKLGIDIKPTIIVKTEQSVVPQVGDTVLAKVMAIEDRYASLRIICVGSRSVKNQDFVGRLKKSDVRVNEPDSVEMHKCFLPGDIVRCEVLSLGTQKSYYLSTTRQSCGVVLGRNNAGGAQFMTPISWNHVQDPVTKVIEPRKVAGNPR